MSGYLVADGQPSLSAANNHSFDLLRHVCALLWQMPLHAPILPAAQSYVKQRLPLTGVDERSSEWPNAPGERRPLGTAPRMRTAPALWAVRSTGVFGSAGGFASPYPLPSLVCGRARVWVGVADSGRGAETDRECDGATDAHRRPPGHTPREFGRVQARRQDRQRLLHLRTGQRCPEAVMDAAPE
jgi:hypothetical protein